MGNPDLGKIAFVFPIQTSSVAGFSNGSNKLQYALKTSNSGLSFCNCKDLYLELVPSMNEVSVISNSTPEPHRHQLENRNSLSPRTPSSYKLQPNLQQVSNMTKGHDSVSNIEYRKAIPFGAHNVEKALANEKSRELLQTCASLWLRARYLLPGNRVAIPMGGQISVFDVLDAEPLSIECPSEESANEGKYVFSHNAQTFNLDHMNCAFVMNYKTKVHINLSLPLVSETPDRRGFTPVQPDCGKTMNTIAGHVIKLGGLSKEYNILKDIIGSLSMKGPLIRHVSIMSMEIHARFMIEEVGYAHTHDRCGYHSHPYETNKSEIAISLSCLFQTHDQFFCMRFFPPFPDNIL